MGPISLALVETSCEEGASDDDAGGGDDAGYAGDDAGDDAGEDYSDDGDLDYGIMVITNTPLRHEKFSLRMAIIVIVIQYYVLNDSG